MTEGPHKRHSTLAIEELRRIELSHMSLRTVHEVRRQRLELIWRPDRLERSTDCSARADRPQGRYLILRVVSKVYQVGGALFVAQSPNGRFVCDSQSFSSR